MSGRAVGGRREAPRTGGPVRDAPGRSGRSVRPSRLGTLAVLLLVLGCSDSHAGDPCDGQTCSSRGFCITDGGRAYCACLRGYHPVRLSCVPNDAVDPCAGVDCNGHGTCSVEDGFPTCDCDPGYGNPGGHELLCLPETGLDADVDVRDGAEDAPGEDAAVADPGADLAPTACEGGWYDPATDLCWQDPPPGGVWRWLDASMYCETLSTGSHGSGSWRLPTISELRTLIRGCPATETGGPCNVTDSCLGDRCYEAVCTGCPAGGGPGPGGHYCSPELAPLEGICLWSSSFNADHPEDLVWSAHFDTANINPHPVAVSPCCVRCVRRGP